MHFCTSTERDKFVRAAMRVRNQHTEQCLGSETERKKIERPAKSRGADDEQRRRLLFSILTRLPPRGSSSRRQRSRREQQSSARRLRRRRRRAWRRPVVKGKEKKRVSDNDGREAYNRRFDLALNTPFPPAAQGIAQICAPLVALQIRVHVKLASVGEKDAAKLGRRWNASGSREQVKLLQLYFWLLLMPCSSFTRLTAAALAGCALAATAVRRAQVTGRATAAERREWETIARGEITERERRGKGGGVERSE